MRGVVTGAANPEIIWALLDRDGTINQKAPEGEYISDAAEVRLMPGAGRAVRRMTEALEVVAVVTNQRGVARGLITPAAVLSVNQRVDELVARAGGRIDGFFVCPHDYDECNCRKPSPGLLRAASHHFGLSLERAVVIGDAESDVTAGNEVGAFTIRLGPTSTRSRANRVAPQITTAVEFVLRMAGR